MQSGDVRLDLERPYLLPAAVARQAGGPSGLLFSFLAFVDRVLAEGPELGAALGLDDQLHRLVALSLLRLSCSHDNLQAHWASRRRRWTPSLDDLVDYIRSHAHLPLTLTDLEVQSRYSARHLQTLFRERFDCTPMQFVRRQRLELAMQQLQAAAPGESVTRIARACGYRHTSNFCSDFQREFGVNASSVLRGSPAQGG